MLRQYSRLKGVRGEDFNYRDMKKVYTIVLYEQSIQAFHDLPEEYIHYGKTTFNTGLRIEFLQEYCLVALDVFREIMYPEGKIKTETQTDAVNKTEAELEALRRELEKLQKSK